MSFLVGILAIIMYSLWIAEALRRNGWRMPNLNPFSALRRKRWEATRTQNPLLTLDDPKDAMTVLCVSLIKSTGEITREQKQLVIATLSAEYRLGEEEAVHYFAHGSFLMRDTVDILHHLHLIAPVLGVRTDTQAEGIKQALMRVADDDGRMQMNAYQTQLIDKTMQLLAKARA